MTREEAKKSLYYKLQFDTLNINDFIDIIYDDFESRTCENCKRCQDEVCVNSDSLLCADFVQPGFGCNKFERLD